MPKFAANLSFLFTEYPFLERFEHASAEGFLGVEFLFPYEWPAPVLARVLADAGLELVLFNLPPGDWGAGDRGVASHPGRQGEFRSGLLKALDYALALNCSRLHALSGLTLPLLPKNHQSETFCKNLVWAADKCLSAGVTLLIEPINSRLDMLGYWLDDPILAFNLQTEIGHSQLRVQLDIYHAVVMGYDPISLLNAHIDQIGHIQIASFPGRHQPGLGKVDFSRVFQVLDDSNYLGWVGCEYKPTQSTAQSLEWFLPFKGRSR